MDPCPEVTWLLAAIGGLGSAVAYLFRELSKARGEHNQDLREAIAEYRKRMNGGSP